MNTKTDNVIFEPSNSDCEKSNIKGILKKIYLSYLPIVFIKAPMKYGCFDILESSSAAPVNTDMEVNTFLPGQSGVDGIVHILNVIFRLSYIRAIQIRT